MIWRSNYIGVFYVGRNDSYGEEVYLESVFVVVLNVVFAVLCDLGLLQHIPVWMLAGVQMVPWSLGMFDVLQPW